MRLAVVRTDIRTWNGEHQERDGRHNDKRDARPSDKAPEFTRVDDGGAAFVWSVIESFLRKLRLHRRDR